MDVAKDGIRGMNCFKKKSEEPQVDEDNVTRQMWGLQYASEM